MRVLRLNVLVVLCVFVGALASADTPALAARGHVSSGTFSKQGAGEGELSNPSGIAVDEATGKVYVSDTGNNRVEYFSAAGIYEGQFNGSGTGLNEGQAAPTGQFADPKEIAVDNSTSPSDPSKGDVYVADIGHDVIDKFSATGEYVGQIVSTAVTPSVQEFDGVAVDQDGGLWIYYEQHENENGAAAAEYKYAAGFTNETVNVPAAYGVKQLLRIGLGNAEPGFAIDSHGEFYVSANQSIEGSGFVKRVVKVDPQTGEFLNREVGAALAEWVAAESSTDDIYLGNGTSVARVDSSGGLIERFGSGNLAHAGGIAVDAVSQTVYVADSAGNDVVVFVLEPPGPPTVESESVGSVNSSDAVLSGEVNPRGASTEYRFEYGRCETLATCGSSGYEVQTPVPDGPAGLGFEVASVSVHPSGLLPHTPYHYRLVAHNERGTVDGVEKTFMTQPSGGGVVLPDGREWELVSPLADRGAIPAPIEGSGIQQAASSGDAFTYRVSYPSEVDPRGYGEPGGLQVLAVRGAGGGWSSENIGLLHDGPTGAASNQGYEYRYFSDNLSIGIAEPLGAFTPQEREGEREEFPEGTERTPYVRHDATCQAERSKCYEPLVTSALEEGDVTSGESFGGLPEAGGRGQVGFYGATPDGEHVVLHSAVQLTAGPALSAEGLYEWSAGLPAAESLQLVSILPASEGGKPGLNPSLGNNAAVNEEARGEISDDGSRVFFSAKAPGQEYEHLYMRDTTMGAEGETVRLDVAEDGSPASQGSAVLQVANGDGSKVLFTDAAPLTANAGENDLYECNIVEVVDVNGSKLKCELSDLTPVPASGSPGAGEQAFVLGAVLGASEDGGYIYFVANGVQAPGASPGDCGGDSPSGTQTCNLYARHDGVISFIATLSGEDSPDWAPGLSRITARMSPDGAWLAFMSGRSLTGYDNRDVKSGVPDEEIYLYSAASGRLTCASCDPNGARPVGMEYAKFKTGLVGGSGEVWEPHQWVAADLPGWTPFQSSAAALHQPRYLSDEGRLFFNSPGALAPQDSNGNWDVYEYEPTGAGGAADCSTGSETFSEGEAGCVGLISSGTALGESALLDASVSGNDVFFLTTGQLVGSDHGTGRKVYDAHVCSSNSPCPAPSAAGASECTSAAACRLAPMTQPSIYGPPSSATFSGSGNTAPPVLGNGKAVVRSRPLTRAQKFVGALRACKKKQAGKRRQSCERAARKRYGPVKGGSARNAARKGSVK